MVLACTQKLTSIFLSLELFRQNRNVKCYTFVESIRGRGLVVEVEGFLRFRVSFFVFKKMLCNLQLTKPISPHPNLTARGFHVVKATLLQKTHKMSPPHSTNLKLVFEHIQSLDLWLPS